MRGLSLFAASRGHSSSQCAGLSLSRPLLLRSTGSRCASSAVVAHGPSRSAACGILPDQGSNPCPLHWQADSQPLRHQGSPILTIFKCTDLWHYVYSCCCTTVITTYLQKFSIFSTETAPIKHYNFPFLPPSNTWQPPFYFLSLRI